jgi:hypothetical protein
MQELFEKSELTQAYNVLQAKIVRYATAHLPGVDVRTAAVLQRAELIKEPFNSHLDATVVEILTSEEHEWTVPVAPGPNIFYKNNGNKLEQFAFEIASGLFESSPEIRLSCLDRVLKGDKESRRYLLSGTRAILIKNREVLSDIRSEAWKSAAILCYDALEEDLLYSVAGLEQALSLRFYDGIQRYSKKIMRPSRLAVEAATAAALSDIESEVSNVFHDIASFSTLEQVCDLYIRNFGFLPFASEISFSHIISTWLAKNENSAPSLAQILDWAEARPFSNSLFAACVYGLERFDVLTEDEANRLQSGLITLISGDGIGSSESRLFGLNLKLRDAVAYHHFTHLRIAYPFLSEERAVITAWWFADRLTAAVGSNEWAITYFLGEFVDSAIDNTTWAAQVSGGPISITPLGMLTSYRGNPWMASFISILGKNLPLDLDGYLSEDFLVKLEEILVLEILSGRVLLNEISSTQMLYFESGGLERLIKNVIRKDKSSKFGAGLEELYTSCSNLALGINLVEKFKDIVALGEADQLVLSKMLKHALLTRSVSFSNIWAVLANQEWNNNLFAKVSMSVLASLFDTFALGRHLEYGEWTVQLPHLYASACESLENKEERLDVLFLFTVISSINSYATSAIERLATSEIRPQLSKAIHDVSNLLTIGLEDSPPWIRSRARAAIPCLT